VRCRSVATNASGTETGVGFGGEREGKRAMEIISFAINLEQIGDIVDKNLRELAAKKIKRRFEFSAERAEELAAFHKRIAESLRIALGVFMSGDVNEAQTLLAEKTALRSAELAATERHLDRLRDGRAESIETTCCATFDGSTRIFAPWPIPYSTHQAIWNLTDEIMALRQDDLRMLAHIGAMRPQRSPTGEQALVNPRV
jgi:hypothetical protein